MDVILTETTTDATIRLMDPRKRKINVAINRKVVEKVYSQSAIVKQIQKVITAAE